MAQPDAGNKQLFMTMALIGLVLLALGVGFTGGLLMGGRQTPASGGGSTVASAADASAHATGHGGEQPGFCVHELAPADAPLLAGLVCNCKEAACNQTPLLACHCATAHSIKDLTKQMIVEGTDKAKIPEELEKRWGSLRPTK